MYKDYLKSKHWQKVRKKKLKSRNYKCQICGTKNTTLDVHHRYYKTINKEKMMDLKVLCRECHDFYHQYFGLNKMKLKFIDRIKNKMKKGIAKKLAFYQVFNSWKSNSRGQARRLAARG